MRVSNDALQYCSFQARSLSLRGWGLIDLPLRTTFSPAHSLADIIHPPYPPIASQSISRDVPLARARASCFLLCTIKPSPPRESPDCPSLRASDEHRFIVRVLRARRIVWRLPSHPSQAARCASTGDHQAPSSLTPLLLPPAHAAQRLLSVHRDQLRPRGHLPPFARSSEPPEDNPPAAGAESAMQKLNR